MSIETEQRPETSGHSRPELARDIADVADTVKRLVRLEIELVKIQAKDTLLPAAFGIGFALAGLVALLFFTVTYLGVLAEANSVVDDWAAGAAAVSLVLAALFGGLGARFARFARALVWVAALFALFMVVFTAMQIVLAIVFEGRRGWAIEALVFFVFALGFLATGGLKIWRAVREGRELKDGVTTLPGLARDAVARARDSWRVGGADS